MGSHRPTGSVDTSRPYIKEEPAKVVLIVPTEMTYENEGFTDEEGNWVSEIRGTRDSPSQRGLDTGNQKGTKIGVEKEHNNEKSGEKKVMSIVVVGSGDYGRALAGRLAQVGYDVTIASRNPNTNRSLIPTGVKISDLSSMSLSSMSGADLIIIAIPKDFYPSLPGSLLSGKVVVDVSNRSSSKREEMSQAEYLSSLYPDCHVVKAFNVVSAYSLMNGGATASKQVYVAGDNIPGRELVCDVVRTAGYTPVDWGLLSAAGDIEDIPLSFFPQWKTPFIIHISIFSLIYLGAFIKFQICWPIIWGNGTFLWTLWNHIPMDNVNKSLAVHALTTLCLCYVPGVIAGWIQIYRGTKYSRFPNWLDNWLKMRKQLGLLMLFAASIHACLSLAIMSPTYHELVYGEPTGIWVNTMEGEGWMKRPSANMSQVKVFGSEKMDWRGESFLMTGVFGFALVVLLGISSLPSVTAVLTWKEFMFIQSGLGWSSLLLVCAHNTLYGWKYINSPSCYIPSSFQTVLYLPMLTVLLKLPLILPPLSSRLTKIRAGYVRAETSKKTSAQSREIENV